MSTHTLENEYLKVTVSDYGAELLSMLEKEHEQELIWCGDARYWARHAPVLFPFVGVPANKQYRYQGKVYAMGQHGFARDREFVCIASSQDTLWFELTEDEKTLKIYPFRFRLQIGYQLADRTLKVLWKVENPDEDSMLYFSIGAHPAFNCPIEADHKQTDYAIDFHTEKPEIWYNLIAKDGMVGIYDRKLLLTQGTARITEDMFDADALIIEGGQTREVSLLMPDQKPYVTVRFDAPLAGIWSPTGKHAPFVCIEPWYGRCDSVDFDGTLEQRAYEQELAPGETFEASYEIFIPER